MPHDRLLRDYLPPRLVVHAAAQSAATARPGTGAQVAELVSLMRAESAVESLATGAPAGTTSVTYTPPPQFPLTVHKVGNGKGTVTSAPAGISCGATCSHGFAQETSVTLTAKASRGSTFAGWSGACTGKTTCSVTIKAATSVTAKFTGKPCVVPNVKGKAVSAAKRALEAHACSAGKIGHAFSRKVKKGRVISQKPKPGSHLGHNGKVRLTVSKGKKG